MQGRGSDQNRLSVIMKTVPTCLESVCNQNKDATLSDSVIPGEKMLGTCMGFVDIRPKTFMIFLS